VPKSTLETQLLAAADDPTGGWLRREAIRAVAASLERNGQRLEFHHWLGGSAAGYGFALAVRMAGQLCAGAALAFDADLAYAGAGSTRQLLEATYPEAEELTTTSAIAERALAEGRITAETANAIRGVTALANLDAGAHQTAEIAPDRAIHYLALVDALLFTIGQNAASRESA